MFVVSNQVRLRLPPAEVPLVVLEYAIDRQLGVDRTGPEALDDGLRSGVRVRVRGDHRVGTAPWPGAGGCPVLLVGCGCAMPCWWRGGWAFTCPSASSPWVELADVEEADHHREDCPMPHVVALRNARAQDGLRAVEQYAHHG